jgi:hypothetical protein
LPGWLFLGIWRKKIRKRIKTNKYEQQLSTETHVRKRFKFIADKKAEREIKARKEYSDLSFKLITAK